MNDESYDIENICIIKNQQIIVAFDNEILILNYYHPYKIIKRMEIPYLFYSLQLKDHRIVTSAFSKKDDNYFIHLIFWNTLTEEKKDSFINSPFLASPRAKIFEMSHKLLLEQSKGFIIYNILTYQVESYVAMPQRLRFW